MIPHPSSLPEPWRQGEHRQVAAHQLIHEAALYDGVEALTDATTPGARWLAWAKVVGLPLGLTMAMLAFTASATVIVQLLVLVFFPSAASTGALTAPVWTLSAALLAAFFGTTALLTPQRRLRLTSRISQKLAGATGLRRRRQSGDRLFELLARLGPLIERDTPIDLWRQTDGWTMAARLGGGQLLGVRVEGQRWSLHLNTPAPVDQLRLTPWPHQGDLSLQRLGGRHQWRLTQAQVGDNAAAWADALASWLHTTAPALHSPQDQPQAQDLIALRPQEPLQLTAPQDTDVVRRASMSAALQLTLPQISRQRRALALAWGRIGLHWLGSATALLLWIQVVATTYTINPPLWPMLAFAAVALATAMITEHPHAPRRHPRRIQTADVRAQGHLQVAGDALSLGPQRIIDMSQPFSVELTHSGSDQPGATLGVELRQRLPEGAELVRVRFAVPAASNEDLHALPRLDMAAPVLDAEDFRAWLWPLIQHRAAAHGQTLPCVASTAA